MEIVQFIHKYLDINLLVNLHGFHQDVYMLRACEHLILVHKIPLIFLFLQKLKEMASWLQHLMHAL